MSGFSLMVPDQGNGNITRRLSTNLRPQSTQTAKLDDLIRNVSMQWKDLVSDNANTLEAALALMDNSSIGKARFHSRFEQFKQELSETLKYHVDANYQGFNSSIGSYRSVVQNIGDSQKSVSDAKEELTRAREGLATRRPALKDLRSSSLKYSAMIDILDKIEELKQVPDKLEMEISQKMFLSANETLGNALRLADSKELEGISALQPIKSYLFSQQSSLFSILTEELHNHVYLKSPYCDSRWSAYTQDNDAFSNAEQVLEDKIKFDMSEKNSTNFSGSAALDEFLTRFDSEQPMADGSKKNIESDSFEYIRLIIETLANLNRLGAEFDVIHQRLPTELHKIVDKTIGEVSMRYPQSLRDLQESKTAGVLDDGYVQSDIRLAVLKDLTWTLYSKLIAVLQGHRVIFEVVESISGRRGEMDNAFCYDFNGVFTIVQSEIRSLLYSYITDKSSNSTAQSRDFHEMLKSTNGTRKARDKTRQLYRLEQVDYYDAEFQHEYHGLQETLENSVPGLVSNAYSGKDRKITPYAPTDLSSAHRLLISPNVFNIRVMLDPTVMFLQKSKAIFPFKNMDAKASSDSFIEEFLVNAFLPQLEDSLALSFHKIMSNPDTMHIDLQWNKVSKRPILKAASAFIDLMKKTCRLLNTGYLYREKYAALVISLLHWVTQYLQDQYDSMVMLQDDGNGKHPKIPARTAQRKELRQLAKRLAELGHLGDDEDAVLQEVRVFLETRTGEHDSLSRADLIDFTRLKTLAIMATSLRWIVLRLKSLRKVSEAEPEEEEESAKANLNNKVKKRWTLMEVNRAAQVDSLERETESLILQGDSLKQFDKAVFELEELANTCVITLRNDARTRVVYYIHKAMTEGDYFTDQDSEERDSLVGLLDKDLIKSDEMVSEYLLQQDKLCIIRGLSRFINQVLVYGADMLQYINTNGVKKMHANIVVLQQMLKSIETDPQQVDFRRAIEFYKTFGSSSPTVFLEKVKNGKVNMKYDEAKIMLRLMHNEAIRKLELTSTRQNAANQQKQTMQTHLHELHEYFYAS